jgi:hypothetical protein
MNGHPILCVCPACAQRRETQLRQRVELLETTLRAVHLHLMVRPEARVPETDRGLKEMVADVLRVQQ